MKLGTILQALDAMEYYLNASGRLAHKPSAEATKANISHVVCRKAVADLRKEINELDLGVLRESS